MWRLQRKICDERERLIQIVALGWTYQFSHKRPPKHSALESIANLLVLFVPFCGYCPGVAKDRCGCGWVR